MADTAAALKHRADALEEENRKLHAKLVQTPVHSFTHEGRAIRRLVDLVIPLRDLIAEHDRRLELGAEDEVSADAIQSSTEEDYIYRSFKRLVHWCPSVQKLLNSEVDYDMSLALRELKIGADGGRADNTGRLKVTVANWLNNAQQRPDPLLRPEDKLRRGFSHDVTGRLLCPVDYDWVDPSVRAAIREYHPKYPVTANMYPAFLYDGHYDPKNPSKGLFQGEYLVKAFRCIFTSPSSAEDEPDCNEAGSRQAKRIRLYKKPRRNVAQLLKMRSVDPRAIAYIACQLHFALSSSTSWDLNDEVFDYNLFYRNIIDYIERPLSPRKSAEIQDLLLWWNRKIFNHRHGTHYYEPQQEGNLSVSLARM